MNSLRNDSKHKKNREPIFTTETFGVVLILFSALSLVCLISRDKVFSLPGLYVCDFLVGLFGYCSVAVCFSVFVTGFLLLLGKRINVSLKYKAKLTLCTFFLALLLHVISMAEYSGLQYAEYIEKAYALGEGGLANATCGGMALSFIAYFFPNLLTNVGSYVIISICLGGSIFFLFKDVINSSEKSSSSITTNFKSSYMGENAKDIPTPENLEEMDYPVENIDFSEQNTPTQKLFVNNPEDFEFKTKRDMKKEEGESIKLNYGNSGFAVGNTTLKATYERELEKKINYIKTPANIEINKDVYAQKQDNGDVRISKPIKDYVQPEKTDTPEKKVDNQKPAKSIPLYEHDESTSFSAGSNAERFSDRYVDIPDEDISAPTTTSEAPYHSFDPDTFNDTPASSISGEFREIEKEEGIIDANDFSRSANTQSEIPTSSVKENIDKTFSNTQKPNHSSTYVDFSNEGKTSGNAGFESKKTFEQKPKMDMGFSRPQRQVENAKPQEEEKPKKEPPPINRKYNKPPLDLLESRIAPVGAETEDHSGRMEVIKRTLEEFHINAEPESYVQGPSVTRYEIKMPAGVSVKKVLTLDDDLRMRLASKNGIRIEAPIPGKDLVGIEVANKVKQTVGLREILEQAAKKPSKPNALMFALGKNIVGDAITDNLAKGPHYLVAGATGSGKSVCLNIMIISMIMRYSPEELRLILVDPKSVGFRIYEHLPHLMIDEIITEPQKTIATLQWAYVEMEKRYQIFKNCDQLIMDIEAYNERIASSTVPKIPRIVIIIDELADLMETCKKDMENKIRALAQKSRAAGIHLVLATQRPSVDIITGTIKANLPSRIALKVMNFADSNTILSEGGAEKLLGNGDMLYKNSSMAEYERYQGAWISDMEITNVVSYIKENNKAYFDDELADYLENTLHPKQEESSASLDDGEDSIENDDIFKRSLALGINTGAISISMIQRRFSVGFSRAGRIVDAMEKLGYIGANEGNSKGRKVLFTRDDYESRYGEMPE